VINSVSPAMDPAMDMSVAMSQGIHMCHGCDRITTGERFCSRCAEEIEALERAEKRAVARQERIVLPIDEEYEEERKRFEFLFDSACVLLMAGVLFLVYHFCAR
jgi:hypothetical protein